MATGRFEFFSTALSRPVSFNIVLPNDVPPFILGDNPHFKRPMKLLMLLHGYNGSENDWLYHSNVVELAGMYNLAIVLPAGENSFYLNGEATGRAYATYLGEELPNYIYKTFGVGGKREDVLIGGLSMGGFGALHTAIQFNQNIAGAVCLSSALIQHQLKNFTPEMENPVANYAYYALMFGDLQKVEESINCPEYLYEQKKAAGEVLPKIYMACGTEDFLIKENENTSSILAGLGADIKFETGPGVHNFEFWNKYLEPGIKYILGLEE